ncbi:MAG: selenide, water dikinase SelD [Gammaproteobacteria bacterium]|nr:selenide, water dikinase SelD [Gammaproteobacteria bacterium]
MLNSAPDEHDLVLVGGGHSHLAVLRRFMMRPLPGVRLTLVARELHTPYSGMLPGLVAGHYDFDAVHVDLGPLAAAAGARLIHAELAGLDTSERLLRFEDRPALRYDTLSINSGATPSLAGLTGRIDRLRRVKPIALFLPALDAVLARLGQVSAPLDVVVVGGGPGGVELALALAHRLRRDGVRGQARLRLVTAGERLLAEQGGGVARLLSAELMRAGVEVTLDARIVAVGDDQLQVADGSMLAADEVIWATGAVPPPWLAPSGLELADDGFLAVGPTLQSLSHPDVFAAGDVAALTHAPRPKSGVYAVRAGRILAQNLDAWVRGRRLRRFRPQQRALYLISTGDKRAVVARPGLPALRGGAVWRWKDWIDRRFMARFSELPPMRSTTPASAVAAARGGQRLAAGMRCRGCGGKIAAEPLGRALSGLRHGADEDGPAGRPHIEDAAALPIAGVLLEQTIDGFTLPVSDPYLGGRLAALHALGDLHAMGADPVAALALAGVPYAGRAQMEQDLAQMMAGAKRELEAAGAPLLGGHSCENESLSLGLALTGRIPSDRDEDVLGKDRMRPGQCLILTKPLGTGALLAGAAAGRVASRDLEAALACMLLSNAAAVARLREHGATACTDVTGFGLLGHALEMAQASACGVEIHPDRVVPLPAALAAMDAGIVSSLQAANEDVMAMVELGKGLRPGEAMVRLLCDPQTCGGLLAAVPESQASACVAALRSAGFVHADIVGSVIEAADPGTVMRLTRFSPVGAWGG